MSVKLKIFSVLSAMLLGTAFGSAASPTVSNVRAAQRAGTQLVDVYYDLASASNSLTVYAAVSTNGGTDYTLPATSFIGVVGAGIAPGTNLKITWNAGTDWPTNFSTNIRFRITADDAVPGGMALIPAGTFTMGNCMDPSEGFSSELPLHTVYVSAFYMDKYDVTYTIWTNVYQWATYHGYSFDCAGSGKAMNHPVQTIDWYDCVKWCNARSEMEGRTPAYYTNAAQTPAMIYRTGQVAVDNSSVKWNAGYRLPTEAEWEKAARGGASGQRFPWGNTISESQANYYSHNGYAYDLSNTGFNPTFNDGVYPYTSPVVYFAPNGYGLYDMAGNVWQWCWDWCDVSWYSNAGATQADPRGPASGSYRVYRGGGWSLDSFGCRSALRNSYGPDGYGYLVGFRSVLPPGDLPVITVQPSDRSISPGGTVTFSVTATGGTPLYYQWQNNGVNIPGATGASLTLTNVHSGGYYSVVVSNGLGIITSRSAHLTVSSYGEI